MLFATVLLAAQAGRRATPSDARGSMPAPCNSNTLLNEFTDCHIPCGVHTHGAATGSSCSTNFCGVDGSCCRQGVTAGVCDGSMGCNGWHCCVCHSSSTHSPTGAPAVSIAGDPFTTFQGKKTQFYMPPSVVMPLIQCGHVELLGRAINSVIKGDDQQWFDMFQLRVNASEVLVVEARRTQVGSAKAMQSIDVDADAARVAGVLQKARLVAAAKQTAVRSLTTLDVQVQGKVTNTTGSLKVGSATISIEQDIAKSIGAGFVEIVQFDSADVGLKVQSSVAGKFANDADRIRNLHVDIAFTNINAAQCSGTLPEIWGVKSMTKATAKLLIPK